MTNPRHVRAFRSIGGLPGHLSRPPQRLPDPDIRPGLSIVPATLVISNMAVQESNATTQTIKVSPSGPSNNVVANGGVVIAVCLKSTQSVASITNTVGGGSAGFTLIQSYTAQGRKLLFYAQRFATAQTGPEWTVTITPSIAFSFADRWYLGAFTTSASSGPVIRAISEADAAAATSITFPSLSFPKAGYIFTLSYSFGPGSPGFNPWIPTSPLSAAASIQFSFSGINYGWFEGKQAWLSSAATGTRTHTVGTGTTSATGIGAMVLL